MLSINHFVAQQLDKFVLYTMNLRMPDTFELSYKDVPALETILAQTQIDTQKTAVYMLSAPGTHPIWLKTIAGELQCHIRVRPAVNPEAPLVIYHHGFSEIPYDHSWRRIFCQAKPFPAHAVCIQAPFHQHWTEPFAKGMASLRSLYQVLAGSLRMMELVQAHFATHGAPYTILSGVSWGGVTSLMYEALFGQTRAVTPMLSSPNFAQVLIDAAQFFNRPLSVPHRRIHQLLDFTPYYEQCDPNRIFPLLGEKDLFFRFDHHINAFGKRPLTIVPSGHISGMWQAGPLRQHILEVLHWADNHPLS